MDDKIVCLQCGKEFPFDDSMDEDLLVQFICEDCRYDDYLQYQNSESILEE